MNEVSSYFLPINLTSPSSSSTFFTIDRCERYQLAIKLNNAKAIMNNFVKMKKVKIFLTQWWVGYEIFYAMNKYSSAYIPGSSFLAIVMLASSLFCILFISTRILIFKHWVFLYDRGFRFIFGSAIIWRFVSPSIHFLSEFELQRYVQTRSKKLVIFLGYNHLIKQCNFKIFSNHQLLEKGSCTHRLHTLNEINTLNNFKWSSRISYLASYEFLS